MDCEKLWSKSLASENAILSDSSFGKCCNFWTVFLQKVLLLHRECKPHNLCHAIDVTFQRSQNKLLMSNYPLRDFRQYFRDEVGVGLFRECDLRAFQKSAGSLIVLLFLQNVAQAFGDCQKVYENKLLLCKIRKQSRGGIMSSQNPRKWQNWFQR